MKFARIFEKDEQQILAMTEYRDEEDATCLRLITVRDGIRTEKAFIYRGETQTEVAARALEILTEEDAFKAIGISLKDLVEV